eukprot:jgi/Ulvmu1/4438/UM002_0163.1
MSKLLQQVVAVDAEEGWTPVQVANATEIMLRIQSLRAVAGNITSWTSPVFFTEFRSIDTAGNEAVAAIATVISVICEVGGKLCPDLSCAVFGLCGLASHHVLTTSQYDIRLGPQISLKGNGQIIDNNVMEHIVQFGSDVFEVPSVVAFDELDGNLTGRVATFGLKSFSVTSATSPGTPHLISYSVTDSDGNTAEAGRTINVACTSEQLLCTANGRAWVTAGPTEDYLHCSRDSFCGPIVPVVSVRSQPTISLIGEALLILPVDAVYAKCPYPRPLDSVCDLGAAAHDPVEGDLSGYVKVCSTPGSSSMTTVDASSFSKYGVRYCSIDTHVPGVQNVTFWVADSTGSIAFTSRMIMVVRPVSPVLQAASPAELSVFDVEASILDPSGQLYLSEQDRALFQTLKTLLSEKSVLNISLEPVRSYTSQNAGLETVELPQGTSLSRCPKNLVLTQSDGFCDAGATVTTPAGVDLSGRLVACPSAECFKTGCPGKRFDAVGLTTCSIDVFAEVGTKYEIEYMAYDDSMPANIVTANRSVVIVAPCEPGKHLCGLACSSVPCEALNRFFNPIMNPAFEMPDSSLTVIHLPCTGTSFPARQAAVCEDASMIGSNICVGMIGVDEYYPGLVKTEVKPSACPLFNTQLGAEPSLACPPCVLPLLNAGACAPGLYDIMYSYAYPDLDAPMPQTRSVVIHSEQSVVFEQLISVSMKVNLLSIVSDFAVSDLRQALQSVMADTWPAVRQSIEDEFYSRVQGQAAQIQLTYLTLSATARDEWQAGGNSPSTVDGVAWVHGMVSNSNESMPWLDPSTVSNNVSSAMLSAIQSAFNQTRLVRTTWLELGLAERGVLDAFETTVTIMFKAAGEFLSISTGTVCPLWTDGQVLSLSADVVSQQVTDTLDRLRIIGQGTKKAMPLLAEADLVISMQFLGAGWCDLARDITTAAQALSLDISDDIGNEQADIASSLQLALLAGSQTSDCLERLNDLALLQAGTLSDTRDDVAAQRIPSTESAPVHELGSQIVWQVSSHRVINASLSSHAAHGGFRMQSNAVGPLQRSGRRVLDSIEFHQPAFDMDNAAEVQPTTLDCIQGLQQEGCSAIPRVFGHERSDTQVLGGLLIHQTRESAVECTKGYQERLSFQCAADTRARGIATQVRACMPNAAASLPGFGSEPARNGKSSLFNPLLDVQDYYNTSNFPYEADCRGEPRPFQAVNLQGYKPGYPIVMEACAGAAAAVRALQYVRDSR